MESPAGLGGAPDALKEALKEPQGPPKSNGDPCGGPWKPLLKPPGAPDDDGPFLLQPDEPDGLEEPEEPEEALEQAIIWAWRGKRRQWAHAA
jgi:hypothetical protein